MKQAKENESMEQPSEEEAKNEKEVEEKDEDEENLIDISKEHKSLDYGIQKENIYHLLPTQMQIGKVVLMTNEAPVEQCST
jgi:hypothetical protein